jgi:hypothetical protein
MLSEDYRLIKPEDSRLDLECYCSRRQSMTWLRWRVGLGSAMGNKVISVMRFNNPLKEINGIPNRREE